MKVTLYKQPDGRAEVLEIQNVYQEDAEFFENNNIRISMEELAGQFVVYAGTGMEDECGEPIEFVELSLGRSCQEVLKILREKCETLMRGEVK